MATDLGGRQKRSLTGLALVGGGAIAVLSSPGLTTVHTLDGSDPENGGFYIDEITLYAVNKSAAARIVQVFLDGTIIWEGSLPATQALNATSIFDGQPMKRPTVASLGIITIQAAAAADDTDIYCWGWFIRG